MKSSSLSVIVRPVRSALNRLGLDLVRIRNSQATLDTHVANVLQTHAIDCVIDVGANVGQYGRFLRKLGFKGAIASFEPVAATFEELSDLASKDAHWHVYPFALGSSEGVKAIHVYSSSDFASFYQATEYARETWETLQTSTEESVQVRRLDGVFENIRTATGAHNFYLKMDTQGHDKAVFEGAQGTLTFVRAIQSELSMIPVYESTPQAAEMLKYFQGNGFQVSGMYPINRDQRTLAVIEYDCVFVRGDA
jgi:FkbM family methyltransferase